TGGAVTAHPRYAGWVSGKEPEVGPASRAGLGDEVPLGSQDLPRGSRRGVELRGAAGVAVAAQAGDAAVPPHTPGVPVLHPPCPPAPPRRASATRRPGAPRSATPICVVTSHSRSASGSGSPGFSHVTRSPNRPRYQRVVTSVRGSATTTIRSPGSNTVSSSTYRLRLRWLTGSRSGERHRSIRVPTESAMSMPAAQRTSTSRSARRGAHHSISAAQPTLASRQIAGARCCESRQQPAYGYFPRIAATKFSANGRRHNTKSGRLPLRQHHQTPPRKRRVVTVLPPLESPTG